MPLLSEHPNEEMSLVKEGESLDDLTVKGYKVIQSKKGYRFSMDSVLLADFARARPGENILDLGCGSGVVSLLVAARQPECRITGIEIQKELADRARRSVILNGLQGRISIINGDVRRLEVITAGSYDMVVCNPPFQKAGEGKTSFNEEKLIARHEIMACFNDFVRAAYRALKRGGRMVVVHKTRRLVEIITTCQEGGLTPKRMRMVHSRKDLEADLFLLEAQKGAKEGVKVLPGLIVYEDTGKYSQEILEIYKGSGL